MLKPDSLVGRRDVVRRVRDLLARDQSVLLAGPAGVGKSAIIGALEWPASLVVDPFERVSRQKAAAIRRGMDRGCVYLAAARSLDRAAAGCVGRIAWRMTTVRVPPLPARAVRTLILRAVVASGVTRSAVEEAWLTAAVRAARGIPGRALGLAESTAAHWRQTGRLLSPALGITRALAASVGGGPGPASPSCGMAGPR